MPIEVVKESIFQYDPNDYVKDTKRLFLVDPVNCNLNVMGKGLALEFKKRYPDQFTKYSLSNEHVDIGHLSFIPLPHYNITIVLFPTKIYWRNPSKYWYISPGLVELKNALYEIEYNEGRWGLDDVEQLDFTIRMPKLGCGLGGLDFREVYEMIKTIFKQDTPYHIKICDI